MHQFIILAAAAAAQQSPVTEPSETIVVTASREPVEQADAAVSATVFEREQLEELGYALSADVLRLVPGVSVSVSGPPGSQTDLRIRGAEADHTLIFVDGIRFNDPAAGNAPRFDLLTTDLLSRIEVVRGPQSALWGSEALGGVIAVETANAFATPGATLSAEYGSHDSSRLSGQAAAQLGKLGISGSAAWLRSEGIDAFGSDGEPDGFENRSGSMKAVFRPLPSGELGIVGHYVEGESEFDSFDPVTFRRADTLDATDNRVFAIRGWGTMRTGGWSLLLDGSYLDSENRNRVGAAPLNSTFGSRFTLGAQLSRYFGGHRITAAAEHEGEEFRARDQLYFGATDQDRARDVNAFIGQWRAEWSDRLITDVAVRHDQFSAFADATTVRGTALVKLAEAWTLHGSYGEGIAQPGFYDLFGFFPGSFVGNPALRPESSKGWEAGVRWRTSSSTFGVTGFTNRLKDEIVATFDPTSFLGSTINVEGRSRRRGVEIDGYHRWRGFGIGANYTYLDATEQRTAGTAQIREARRPRHSGNLYATGSIGPVVVGASLAYVGERRDTDFDTFPAQPVTLDDYLLGSLKLGWTVSQTLEAYARVENLFDASHEDAFGYNTPGRTVYAGIRLRLGR